MNPNFSTLGSIIGVSRKETLISFTPDDNISVRLGFNPETVNEIYDLSPNRVDILWSDINFFGTDIAEGNVFKGEGSGMIHDFSLDVGPVYKCTEKFQGGNIWYTMESGVFFFKK